MLSRHEKRFHRRLITFTDLFKLARKGRGRLLFLGYFPKQKQSLIVPSSNLQLMVEKVLDTLFRSLEAHTNWEELDSHSGMPNTTTLNFLSSEETDVGTDLELLSVPSQ